MKENQDELRAKIKPYINSVTGIGKKFGIEPMYFYKWFNGLPVGKSTLDKIKAGIEKLGSE